MTTTWTIEVDWERSGDFAGISDDITTYVMQARWFNGFRRPYQDVADEQMLSLQLNNEDKRFSPENSSSPLYGNLAPFRPVCVRSDDGTTVRTHYIGWIESIEPDVNQYGNRTVKILCSGPASLFMASAETDIPVQANKRTDEIVDALLNEVRVPPPLVGSAIIGLPSSIIGSVNVVDIQMERSLQEGKTTLAFAADNWVRRNDKDDSERTYSIYRAIKDVVSAERGRFYFNREGEAVFWNRHRLITERTVQATFDNLMVDMRYNYASLGEFANDITVTCHPRSVSESNDDLLWQLDEPITLQPDKEREIGASYRDDSDNRIGGRNIRLQGVAFEQGSQYIDGNLYIEKDGANRATLHLRNPSNSKQVKLIACQVRGQKITDYGRTEAFARDTLSMTLYGRRDMKMNLRSVDNQQYAQRYLQCLWQKSPESNIRQRFGQAH